MKKMIAMLLALMLAVGMLALTVSAESPKGESDTVEAPVITVGEGELVGSEGFTIEQYQEGIASESFEKEQYKEGMDSESFEKELYAEEGTGFWAWLKNLWRAILSFFGL